MLVQVKHKRTLYRFLLSKIECARINGGINSETQQITTTIGRTNAKYYQSQRLLRSQKGATILLRQSTNTD